MKLALLAVLLLGCGGQAAEPASPAAPPPPSSDARPAASSPYACKPLGQRPVSVNIAAGYSAADVAAWLIAWSCRAVVVPRHVRDRTAKVGLSELVKGDDLPGVLDRLLVGLDLVAVTEGRITVFIDADARLASGQPELIWSGQEATSPAPKPSRPAVSDPLAGAITKLAEHHYRIRRDALFEALANPQALARGARFVPSIKDGRADGFKLYAIRPSSAFARLGLRNGDTVHRINGREMSSPDQALEAYVEIREADGIVVEVTRRGAPVTLRYDIR